MCPVHVDGHCGCIACASYKASNQSLTMSRPDPERLERQKYRPAAATPHSEVAAAAGERPREMTKVPSDVPSSTLISFIAPSQAASGSGKWSGSTEGTESMALLALTVRVKVGGTPAGTEAASKDGAAVWDCSCSCGPSSSGA